MSNIDSAKERLRADITIPGVGNSAVVYVEDVVAVLAELERLQRERAEMQDISKTEQP